MKCKEVMKQVFESDSIENTSFRIWIHLLFCKNCKTETERINLTLASFQQTTPYKISNPGLKNSIMNEILKTGIEYNHKISYFKWVSVGTIIIGSRFLFSYSDYSKWLSQHFGTNFDLPLNIVLGSIISVYALIFIGTHVEDLKKLSRYISNKFS